MNNENRDNIEDEDIGEPVFIITRNEDDRPIVNLPKGFNNVTGVFVIEAALMLQSVFINLLEDSKQLGFCNILQERMLKYYGSKNFNDNIINASASPDEHALKSLEFEDEEEDEI